MRSLAELVDKDDSALPLIKGWISNSSLHNEILVPSDRRAEVLLGLQVSTHSTMGTVAYETGGMLIDFGWLRILGSGSEKLNRDLLSWNEGRSSGYLLAADDVIGGHFAVNGGGARC